MGSPKDCKEEVVDLGLSVVDKTGKGCNSNGLEGLYVQDNEDVVVGSGKDLACSISTFSSSLCILVTSDGIHESGLVIKSSKFFSDNFCNGLCSLIIKNDSLAWVDWALFSSAMSMLLSLDGCLTTLVSLLLSDSHDDADVGLVSAIGNGGGLVGNNDLSKHLALSLSCSSCNRTLSQDDTIEDELIVSVVLSGTSEGRLQLVLFGPVCWS